MAGLRGALRSAAPWGLALLMCTAGVACSGDGGHEHEITLEVRDGWIRVPGSECAGSRPLLYVHRDAEFQIEARSDGRVVSEGALPAGEAVKAVDEDLESERVPTFCRFRFEVSIPGNGDYEFVMDEGTPVDFSIDSDTSDVSLTLP
jgi:hypothetical protein